MILTRIMTMALLAAVVVFGSGCGAGQAAAVAPLKDVGPHPADELAAAQLLPSDTLAMVSLRDVWTVLDRLGRHELIAGMREDYERLIYEVIEETGFDLLSPEGLGELGVEGGEVTVALLADPPDQIALVLKLTSPSSFKRALYRWGGGRRGRGGLGPPRVIEGSVLIGEGDMAVLVQGETALVLLGFDAADTAERLARAPASDKLAHRRAFRVAMRRAQDARLRGWLDVRGLVYQQAGMDPRWGGSTLAEARRRLELAQRRALADARERGAGVEEIVAIDDGFRQARKSLDDEDDERSTALRTMLGSVEGAALSGQFMPDGLDLQLDVELAEGSWLRKLLHGRGKVPTIASTVEQAPWLVVQAAIDPHELMGLSALLGSGPDGLSKGLGIDVERRLLPLLSGELEAVVWAPEGAAAALKDSEALSLSAMLMVNDPHAFMKVLAELDESELVGALIAHKKKRWQLELPGVAALDVTAKKDRVISTNAKGWPARGGSFVGLSPPARLLVQPAALAVYLDVGMTLLEHLSGPRFVSGPPRLPDRDPDVPESDAYRAKLAELTAHARQMETALASSWLQQAKEREARLRHLGAVALRVSRSDYGARVELKYATDGTPMREALGELAKLRHEPRDGEPRSEVERLFEHQAQLEEELDAIYAGEVDAFMRAGAEATDKKAGNEKDGAAPKR